MIILIHMRFFSPEKRIQIQMAKGIYLYYSRCCMCHGEESPKLMAKYGKDLFCCKPVQFPENKVIPWCSSSKQIMMVPSSMYEHC